jgi:hypothetical protein
MLCVSPAFNLLAGWDQGCLGMKKGEVRKLVIPADEGYGAGGFPAWGIPPGGAAISRLAALMPSHKINCAGTLDFTLECLEIK